MNLLIVLFYPFTIESNFFMSPQKYASLQFMRAAELCPRYSTKSNTGSPNSPYSSTEIGSCLAEISAKSGKTRVNYEFFGATIATSSDPEAARHQCCLQTPEVGWLYSRFHGRIEMRRWLVSGRKCICEENRSLRGISEGARAVRQAPRFGRGGRENPDPKHSQVSRLRSRTPVLKVPNARLKRPPDWQRNTALPRGSLHPPGKSVRTR